MISKEQRLAEFRQASTNFLDLVQTNPDATAAIVGIIICPIPDSRCCAYCSKKKGVMVRKESLTLKKLPPFDGCGNREEGCRCAFIQLSKEQWKQRKQMTKESR